jgi:hypothetical protein
VANATAKKKRSKGGKRGPVEPRLIRVQCACDICAEVRATGTIQGKPGHIDPHRREGWPNCYVGWSGHSRERIKRMVRQEMRRAKGSKDAAFVEIHRELVAARWYVSYECDQEMNAPKPVEEQKRRQFNTMHDERSEEERQAVRDGLSIRNPVRGMWSPLLQSGCEGCEGLRPARRRYCLNCESRAFRELDEAGWDAEMIERYLRAPSHGHDEFAVTTDQAAS